MRRQLGIKWEDKIFAINFLDNWFYIPTKEFAPKQYLPAPPPFTDMIAQDCTQFAASKQQFHHTTSSFNFSARFTICQLCYLCGFFWVWVNDTNHEQFLSTSFDALMVYDLWKTKLCKTLFCYLFAVLHSSNICNYLCGYYATDCHVEVPFSHIYTGEIFLWPRFKYFSRDFGCDLRLSMCVSMTPVMQSFPNARLCWVCALLSYITATNSAIVCLSFFVHFQLLPNFQVLRVSDAGFCLQLLSLTQRAINRPGFLRPLFGHHSLKNLISVAINTCN